MFRCGRDSDGRLVDAMGDWWHSCLVWMGKGLHIKRQSVLALAGSPTCIVCQSQKWHVPLSADMVQLCWEVGPWYPTNKQLTRKQQETNNPLREKGWQKGIERIGKVAGRRRKEGSARRAAASKGKEEKRRRGPGNPGNRIKSYKIVLKSFKLVQNRLNPYKFI